MHARYLVLTPRGGPARGGPPAGADDLVGRPPPACGTTQIQRLAELERELDRLLARVERSSDGSDELPSRTWRRPAGRRRERGRRRGRGAARRANRTAYVMGPGHARGVPRCGDLADLETISEYTARTVASTSGCWTSWPVPRWSGRVPGPGRGRARAVAPGSELSARRSPPCIRRSSVPSASPRRHGRARAARGAAPGARGGGFRAETWRTCGPSAGVRTRRRSSDCSAQPAVARGDAARPVETGERFSGYASGTAGSSAAVDGDGRSSTPAVHGSQPVAALGSYLRVRYGDGARSCS